MVLALLAGSLLSTEPGFAVAKDGGDGDSDGGHGGDDGGGDDGDNSGPGGGDDGGDDGGGDDHGSDKGKKKKDDDEWSQDRALKERELGRVIPLQAALRIVAGQVRGRVIDVDLLARGGKPQYRVKVRRTDGVIQTVRLDARTGRVIGFLGF
jgi:hypothetical protein